MLYIYPSGYTAYIRRGLCLLYMTGIPEPQLNNSKVPTPSFCYNPCPWERVGEINCIMDIDDYLIQTKDSKGKKCTVYTLDGNDYSGEYSGDGYSVECKGLTLFLKLDLATKNRLMYYGVEQDVNGECNIIIRVSCIDKINFD